MGILTEEISSRNIPEGEEGVANKGGAGATESTGEVSALRMRGILSP